jgi:hypothetical protein
MFGGGEPVYKGRANEIVLVPYANRATQQRLDMSGVYEVRVCIAGASFSSDDYNQEIKWVEVTQEGKEPYWEISLRLGLLPDIPEGEQDVRITLFDTDYADGFVLTDSLRVNVIGVC